MPRAPRKCGHTGCTSRAVRRGRCEAHAPAPFEGARERWKEHRPPGWDRRRRAVIRRARGRCELCGLPGHQVDHIRPVAEGGSWELDNLQLLCDSCHRQKSQEDAQRGRARKRKV